MCIHLTLVIDGHLQLLIVKFTTVNRYWLSWITRSTRTNGWFSEGGPTCADDRNRWMIATGLWTSLAVKRVYQNPLAESELAKLVTMRRARQAGDGRSATFPQPGGNSLLDLLKAPNPTVKIITFRGVIWKYHSSRQHWFGAHPFRRHLPSRVTGTWDGSSAQRQEALLALTKGRERVQRQCSSPHGGGHFRPHQEACHHHEGILQIRGVRPWIMGWPVLWTSCELSIRLLGCDTGQMQLSKESFYHKLKCGRNCRLILVDERQSNGQPFLGIFNHLIVCTRAAFVFPSDPRD